MNYKCTYRYLYLNVIMVLMILLYIGWKVKRVQCCLQSTVFSFRFQCHAPACCYSILYLTKMFSRNIFCYCGVADVFFFLLDDFSAIVQSLEGVYDLLYSSNMYCSLKYLFDRLSGKKWNPVYLYWLYFFFLYFSVISSKR